MGLLFYSLRYAIIYIYSCLAHFVFQYLISSLAFIIAGLSYKLSLFSQTSGLVLFIVLFLWGNVQISLAFFLSSLFKKSRTANISVIFIVLFSVLSSMALNMMYLNEAMPRFLFLWPPFAFYRVLNLLGVTASTPTMRPYYFVELNTSSELGLALFYLLVEFFVYFLLSIYIKLVAPKEYGVRKPWHFPVTDLIKYFKEKKTNVNIPRHSENDFLINVFESELELEDEDVKEERNRVLSGDYGVRCPLVMKNMRKVFDGRGRLGPKLAVKDVTLAVEQGIVFGLLGPNGYSIFESMYKD